VSGFEIGPPPEKRRVPEDLIGRLDETVLRIGQFTPTTEEKDMTSTTLAEIARIFNTLTKILESLVK
jgi:hypothetical protein